MLTPTFTKATSHDNTMLQVMQGNHAKISKLQTTLPSEC